MDYIGHYVPGTFLLFYLSVINYSPCVNILTLCVIYRKYGRMISILVYKQNKTVNKTKYKSISFEENKVPDRA